jgi:hypothetical protein
MSKTAIYFGQYAIYRYGKQWHVAQMTGNRGRIVSIHATQELGIAAARRYTESANAWNDKPAREIST